MKAVQIVAPDILELTEIAPRPLRDNEVRIAVAATCVCGSDLKNISNPLQVPQTPGHEFSGVIVETYGETKSNFKICDRVTAFPMMACMKCVECQNKRYRDCEHKLSLGFQLPGSFAEEIIVDSRLVVPLAQGISFEQGALVEHLCCGFRLSKEFLGQQIPLDSHVLIIGDGPIALADIQGLKLEGYENITLLGKHPLRMDTARKLGASRVFDVLTINATMEANLLPLVDSLIVATPSDQTIDQVLPLLKPHAVIFPQTRITSPKTLQSLEENESVFGRAFAYNLEDFVAVMDLIESGKVLTELLITTHIDLLELSKNFQTFSQKKSHLKTMIINHKLSEIVNNYETERS
jgi:threonine dehydrogenase-like Zn-dependent dehydrogenase